MKPFLTYLHRHASRLKGTLVLSPDLYVKAEAIGYYETCPKDAAYLVDEEGDIHCFKYTGKIQKPGTSNEESQH